MNLLDTVNKLGHYAKKAAKAVINPVNTFLAVSTISAMMSVGELKGQNTVIEGDTLWATGIFSAYNIEDNTPVGGIEIHAYSNTVPMGNNQISKNYTTDNDGWAIFNNPGLPVYIDSTTGINDLIDNKPQVIPTFGSEMNAFFSKIEKGVIDVYDMSGRHVRSQKFNSDHECLAFNDLSSGMYIYNIRTESGVELGGKFIKQNTSLNGPATRPNKNISSFKETETYQANYWIKWTDPEEIFATDSIEVTLTEGNNGFIEIPLNSTITPVPQYQRLRGIIFENTTLSNRMSNATVVVYDETNNQTQILTSDANGIFTSEGIPKGHVVSVSAGGLEGYLSFNDQNYTIPPVIENMSDTLADFFNVPMYTHDPAIQNENIMIQQTSNGASSEIRTYAFHSSVPNQDTTIYNNQIAQYDAIMSDYTHVRTLDFENANIKIYPGTYNTIPTEEIMFQTPLKTYYPVKNATMYLGPNDFGATCHELGQADGRSQCSGTGYLSSNPPPTGPNAEDVAIGKIDEDHWVYNMQVTQNTYFDLNKISFTLDNKSPEFKANPITSTSDFEINYVGK